MKKVILIGLMLVLSGCVHHPYNYTPSGKIRVGMTKEEVVLEWGPPCSYCYGTRHNSYGDSWEYNIFGTAPGYGMGDILFFDENGILTGWSQ